MEKLNEIFFYTVEKAVKSYRQLAQKNIFKAGFNITIDQWLVMKVVVENDRISQEEIADEVFKDAASVTRIIALLINKDYVTALKNDSDKRKSILTVTKKGRVVLKQIHPIIEANRKLAFAGIASKSLRQTADVMKLIQHNCTRDVV